MADVEFGAAADTQAAPVAHDPGRDHRGLSLGLRCAYRIFLHRHRTGLVRGHCHPSRRAGDRAGELAAQGTRADNRFDKITVCQK